MPRGCEGVSRNAGLHKACSAGTLSPAPVLCFCAGCAGSVHYGQKMTRVHESRQLVACLMPQFTFTNTCEAAHHHGNRGAVQLIMDIHANTDRMQTALRKYN
jgi:hypothetical protein